MKKYTPNQYVDIFDKLPMEIKDIVASSATTDHITIVGKKHNLQIDKIGDLVDVTLDVMMGIVSTKDFVKELQDTLQITALEAAVLARDVDENIFKPIKETMTHLYAGKAPYKPSSSLVQYYEEDEEHPALDKDTLLKEIEDPAPAEVKKVIVEPIQKPKQAPVVVKQNTPSAEKPKQEYHTEITEYHVEISNQEAPKPVTSTPTQPQSTSKIPNIVQDTSKIALPQIKPVAPEAMAPKNVLDSDKAKGDSILNQLASIKLSQAFVMPKGPEGIAELTKLESSMPQVKAPQAPVVAPTTELPKVTNTQNTAEAGNQGTAEVKIDPYRERI